VLRNKTKSSSIAHTKFTETPIRVKLATKGARTYGYIMTNSIDHNVQNIAKMESILYHQNQ